MKVNLKSVSAAAAIAAVALLASAPNARADFELNVIDTTSGCAGASCNQSGIVLTAPVGDVITSTPDFSIVSATGFVDTNPNGLELNTLEVTCNTCTTSTTESLQLALSYDQFTGGGPSLLERLTLNSSEPTPPTVSATGTGYEGDTLFSMANATPEVDISSNSSSVLPLVGTSVGGPFSFPSMYALTEVITITFSNDAAGSTANLTGDLTVVPEPGSVALLGGALLAIGTAVRRRARRA